MSAAAARLTVRVVPRGPRDEVLGFQPDGALRVRLSAPPVEGRANEALVRFLAERLGVPRSRVSLVTGAASRTKIVAIEGMTEDAVRERLRET